jgi:serine/threonine protein kinase
MGALQLKEIGRLLLLAAAKVENGSALAPREIAALRVLDECFGDEAHAERMNFLKTTKPWSTCIRAAIEAIEAQRGPLREALARDFGLSVQEFPPRVGDYEVLAMVGRGDLGGIYSARHVPTGRNIELRVWSSFPPQSPEAFPPALLVARAVESIDHPSLGRVHDPCLLEGRICSVVEPVEGATLQELIADARKLYGVKSPGCIGLWAAPRKTEAPFPASGRERKKAALYSLVYLIERVARGLHVAHEAGVIHRNIKPRNIVVRSDGTPVLMDLALGLLEREEGAAPGGSSGAIYGTRAYMSPEQFQGDVFRLDRRTDVYSLAATLFECLTLRRLHDAPSPDDLRWQVLAGKRPDPRGLNVLVPSALKAVLDKALARDRDRRYATALEFAEDLRRVRESAFFRAQFWWPLRLLRKCALRIPVVGALVRRVDRLLFDASGALAR